MATDVPKVANGAFKNWKDECRRSLKTCVCVSAEVWTHLSLLISSFSHQRLAPRNRLAAAVDASKIVYLGGELTLPASGKRVKNRDHVRDTCRLAVGAFGFHRPGRQGPDLRVPAPATCPWSVSLWVRPSARLTSAQPQFIIPGPDGGGC